MAKPTPIEPASPLAPDDSDAMAELMPMTLPLMSTSAPPELPGLIAASVWMALITVAWVAAGRLGLALPAARELLLLLWVLLRPSEVATGRFSADTMPEVTVADRPSGDPTATTS